MIEFCLALEQESVQNFSFRLDFGLTTNVQTWIEEKEEMEAITAL